MTQQQTPDQSETRDSTTQLDFKCSYFDYTVYGAPKVIYIDFIRLGIFASYLAQGPSVYMFIHGSMQDYMSSCDPSMHGWYGPEARGDSESSKITLVIENSSSGYMAI